MIVLATGGRGYADKEYLYVVLDHLNAVHGVSHVIHGAATGADTLAGQWARDRGVQEVACPANWNKHSRRAGYLRNVGMADLIDPHSDVKAVVSFPGGVGTNMMVQIATDRGIEVIDALNYRR